LGSLSTQKFLDEINRGEINPSFLMATQADHANKVYKIEKAIRSFPVELEISGKTTKKYLIKWTTAVKRADMNEGYPALLKKLDELKISYTKTAGGSVDDILIVLPSVPKLSSKIRLVFKFKTKGVAFSDAYMTNMGESLVAWKLAYLINGGGNELTSESLTPGTDSYNDFNSKIGNHVSTWGDTKLMDDCRTFFAIDPNWQKSVNASAKVLKDNVTFNKTGSWVIERPDNLSAQHDPYDVYQKSASKLTMKPNNDKWNPGDIWFINATGKSKLSAYKRDFSGLKTSTDSLNALNEFNGLLIEEFNNGNIVGMSLKKLGDISTGYNVKYKVVNAKNYFDEEVMLDPAKGFVLSPSNQDIQIYLKLRKVERDPMTERVTKRYSFYPQETYLKLKTASGGYRIELYITGTEARHGSLGTKAYMSTIYNTDKTGVDKLNKLRKSYPDLKFGKNETDQFLSFEITKDQDASLLILINSYLSEVYNYVNSSNHIFEKQDLKWLQSKVVASELGYVIKSTDNKKRMDMICENLYRVAASRGVVYGTTSEIKKLFQKKTQHYLGWDKEK
jgi:hypothetical protein